MAYSIVFIMMFLIHTSLALRLDISPSRYTDGSFGPVNISCILDEEDASAMDVFVIHVQKNREKPMVFLQKTSISLDTSVCDPTLYQARSFISKMVGYSYLQVSILEPSKLDEGVYTCKLMYSNTTGLLVEKIASNILTVEKYDVDEVIKHLVGEIASLKDKLKDHTDKDSVIASLQDRVDVLERKSHNQSQQLSYLADQATYSSSFSAVIEAYYTLNIVTAPGDALIFDKILTRTGEGYNDSSGIFTAPRSGLYAFHLVLTSFTNDDYCCKAYVHLVANGKRIANVYIEGAQSGKDDQSSVSTVIELVKGDQVYVINGGYLMRWYYRNTSVFTGFLLKAY